MYTSLAFYLHLAISVLIYWLIPRQIWRTAFLSLSSLVFLFRADANSVYLVLILTAVTWFFGYQIGQSVHKKTWHRIGIALLVLVLVIFKYLGWLDDILEPLLNLFSGFSGYHFDKLLIPLGLSYITFKYISYLTDIYWGLIKPGRFIDFLCYGSLFTIYVAGPIERFERLQPQINNKQIFESSFLEVGFQRIVFGLFKKLVLADWLHYFFSSTWQNLAENSFAMQIVGVLAFALTIYFDFSGYSDIAIGSSRLFGLTIMENFDNPYFAVNISQFWRKWHISLSDWIRDYLFFPLSRMNEKIVWQLIFVPLIAMGLCGLWHGASWSFVLWGLWHGVGLSALQFWGRVKRKRKDIAHLSNQPWFNRFASALTFSFVCIGWIWFIG